MFKLRRNRTADTAGSGAAGSAADAPAPDGGTSPGGRISLLGIGAQVAALVVVGIAMIAGLAMLGDSKLATVVANSQTDRRALDVDRADVILALTAAQRAEATSSAHLAAFGRAGDGIIAGRSVSAASDLAESALTNFAQSLQPLDAAVRAFEAAAAKSFYLRPWDETVNNARETAFIAANKERIASLVKTTESMPANLAGVVLDNQEMTAAARSGLIADAREIFQDKQAPKISALEQSLVTLRTSMIEMMTDLTTRHATLLRAIDVAEIERYESQRSSMRLQILLLMLVLCAGGALIAIYGLALPLGDLTNAATRFADGQFEEPTTVLGRRDEIGRLSAALERIREVVSAQKRGDERDEREQKEAERLAKVTMEREVQQLRRDRERLEQELREREQQPAAQQFTQEAFDGALQEERARLQAEFDAAAQQRTAEIEAQFGPQLAAANAEIERLRGEIERQAALPAPAPAQDPAQKDALERARAEVARLTGELQTLRAAPPPAAEPPALREALSKAESEIKRLQGELETARKAPPQSGDSEKKLREQLTQARNEIARLRNDAVREKNVAQKARTEADAALRAQIARVTADAARETNALERAARAAQEKADEAQRQAQRLASELALEKQNRADDLARERATAERLRAEAERRFGEQNADQLRVINELVSAFEGAVTGTVTAVQTASRDVTLASSQIGEVAARSGHNRGEISARANRATKSIHAAAAAADQIAAAFDELAQQTAASARAAGGAVASMRGALAAVQALEGAAGKMGEAGILITDVAERTNVLSLNATIEAAKAGDAGKGFTVVAAEIKSLANRAGRIGKELSDRVNSVASAVSGVKTAFDTVGKALGEIEALAGATTKTIAQKSPATRAIVSEVNVAAEGTDGVTRAVEDTASSVEATAKIVTQAQGAVDALAQQAQELRKQIDEFLRAIRSA